MNAYTEVTTEFGKMIVEQEKSNYELFNWVIICTCFVKNNQLLFAWILREMSIFKTSNRDQALIGEVKIKIINTVLANPKDIIFQL